MNFSGKPLFREKISDGCFSFYTLLMTEKKIV